ncbi:MAG: YggS family pyridoxal phosphate-dependent enzyme [Rhodospirillaceae bacterium]|jgi:pyridoxal phosphate enzyme (YggS family)
MADGIAAGIGSGIAARILSITEKIRSVAIEAGRDPSDISLMAVSKFHPRSSVELALNSGQLLFGENRVQEAAPKYLGLREKFPELKLHLIGGLQTNKVREAIRLFDTIETVDRPKLALAIAKERDRTSHCPELYVQVNTGEEPQKSGVLPFDVDKLVHEMRDEMELPLSGLMCIPPADEEPAMHFALLAECARRNGLTKLSMGMSGDFERAIFFGATHIRLGTAIFGERV